MADNAGISSLPFDIAPEVADLVADLVGLQEFQTLARMANAGPFECLSCKREGTASKATATAVMVMTSGRPPGHERIMLRLSHRSCLVSQILVVSEKDISPQSESNVTVIAALLRNSDGPRPMLLVDFWTSLIDPGAGPDGGTDLAVSNLLQAGMALVTDIYSPLPRASGFFARVGRRTVGVWDSDGRALLAEDEVLMPPGWRRAIKKTGEITVLAGSGLGLEKGNVDGAVTVARLGRLVGGRISVQHE
jgi:hypothetical protein